jgi:hypothetical protein
MIRLSGHSRAVESLPRTQPEKGGPAFPYRFAYSAPVILRNVVSTASERAEPNAIMPSPGAFDPIGFDTNPNLLQTVQVVPIAGARWR